MAPTRFHFASGGPILPPPWPDRPAIWEMSGKEFPLITNVAVRHFVMGSDDAREG